jgi:hypothetical protein
MLNHYLVGSRVVMVGSCDVVDPNTDERTPTDPTAIKFTREINGGAPIIYIIGDPEVTKLATGVWACTVEANTPGREVWRFEGSGACSAVAEDAFEVLESSL